MDVAVIGAGIVGVSIAIHLLRRGRSVVLIDRNDSTVEASYGNGGMIQTEGLLPPPFPRNIGDLARIALNRSTAVRYDPFSLPGKAAAFARYWWHSESTRYRKIVAESAPLIGGAVAEHRMLAAAAGSQALFRDDGWIRLFRSEDGWRAAMKEADMLEAEFGVPHRKLAAGDLAAIEPHLQPVFQGGIHWHATPTVSDPGDVVDSYIRLFRALGGTTVLAEIRGLEPDRDGWVCHADARGPIRAREIVVAAGISALPLARQLGYRLPLIFKRGYHVHYRPSPDATLRRPVLDTESGYLLAPMRRGIRLATGIEFAGSAAPPSPVQLKRVEPIARAVLDLGERVEASPWMGTRVCTPDMKPIIGAAPRHAGLWFAAALAHRGFTLGPIIGRVLSEVMTGDTPSLDLLPFAMERF
ncbi:MAG: FAD-binding oxidoreductase [Aquamicrobium sp.]|uniref:NAD(P)/FAD-dependent oxidoreductase n=1 Tax=Aquamicrobium sp. TaxID=1872579 RepID=UPI00349E5EA2|nr:FAD-binding oxidoreductase [Aquamicrobium sp.]